MQQGDIWIVNLNPATGSEQAGKRPVVIISGQVLNETLPIVITVPISAKIKSYPTCVALHKTSMNGLKKDSEAVPFQVRTVAKSRLVKRLGKVTDAELRAIVRGLFIVLTR